MHGDDILDSLTVLPSKWYCIDDDIQMSSAPFTPVLPPFDGSQTATKGAGDQPTTAMDMVTAELEPDFLQCSSAPSPSLGYPESLSSVSSADWSVHASNNGFDGTSIDVSSIFRSAPLSCCLLLSLSNFLKRRVPSRML